MRDADGVCGSAPVLRRISHTFVGVRTQPVRRETQIKHASLRILIAYGGAPLVPRCGHALNRHTAMRTKMRRPRYETCGSTMPWTAAGETGLSPQITRKHAQMDAFMSSWHGVAHPLPYLARRCGCALERDRFYNWEDFMSLFTYLRALVRKDEGQDLLEYALLVALIAIVCIVGVTATGTSVNAVFEGITDSLFEPAGAPAP